ncbi:polysaccharide biosynthesis protein [Sphingomonas arenae]|uniref:polysaccharide biosynthesis protein n=1 Tax=Sphingomonas arenae TaxID=2812555 RepID=UPI0019680B75|nr:polysaccharide biosynthesis protein [Sphingomonas arenae]
MDADRAASASTEHGSSLRKHVRSWLASVSISNLDETLMTPARVAPSARFVVVTLLDGAAALVTLLFAMALIRGPVAHVFAEQEGAIALFTVATIIGLGVIGLNWRSWRCISFQDCLALSAALGMSLASAWAACLLLYPQLRSNWLGLLLFVGTHANLLLLAMLGMRALRRSIADYARIRAPDLLSLPRQNILLLGSLEWIKSMGELVKSDRNCRVRVVAALTSDRRAIGLQVAGIPVLGAPLDLPAVASALSRRGTRPASIIVEDEDLDQPVFTQLLALAGQCDIAVTRGQHPHRRERSLGAALSNLLERPEVTLQRDMVERLIRRRRVLVTGAGGTIGSELIRQLATFGPSELILLDHCEYNLYAIDLHVREHCPDILCHGELCCVRDRAAVRRVFERHQPDIVFHAAALKHVPMVEVNPQAGVHTNVLGTRNVADAVCEFGALAMIQISTDKAVNPVGLMGATKRLGELYCQALDLIGQCDPHSPRFMTVRFGNVLGSSGSLIPLFEQQLAAGKPLTVTHPDMERYFMTVGEAVQLILQSCARALETRVHRGTIFVLDMGDPIKIVDIARRMIRLAGLRPEQDVPIKYIGLRPGEKLFEELFDTSETRLRSTIPGVIEAKPAPVPLERLVAGFETLERMIAEGQDESIRDLVHHLIRAPGHPLWAATLQEIEAEDEERLTVFAARDSAGPDIFGSARGGPRPAALQ